MKERSNPKSIPPLTAKTLIELDTLNVNGLNIVFYYLDNGTRSSMQWDLTNPDDSDHNDGTDHSAILLNHLVLKYLTDEGILDMWNKFIKNPKTQKWMITRRNGGFRKPRQSTVNQLIKLYGWYKNKYTTIKL